MSICEKIKYVAFGAVCGFATGIIAYCWVHIIAR